MAQNGQEVLDIVKSNQVDLIFMDCQKPVVDGYETTSKLRIQHFEGPIIELTANALEGDREKCLGAGMDDYLPKPINLKALRDALEKWLHNQES